MKFQRFTKTQRTPTPVTGSCPPPNYPPNIPTATDGTCPPKIMCLICRGPVVNDGYGIAYQVNRNSLSFNITCRKDNPEKNVELSAERLSHYIREAGDHMKDVWSSGTEIKARL